MRGEYLQVSRLDDIDQETLQHIIHHVFLPECLPQNGDQNTSEKDIAMLAYIYENLQDFALNTELGAAICSKSDIEKIMEMLRMFIEVHANGQLEREGLEQELRRMRVNDYLPLYIEAQNAGIIVRRMQNEVIFESFEVSPDNQSVVECQGRLLCSYPGPSIAIPVIIFRDSAFRKELVQCLVSMSDAPPTIKASEMARKARTEITEDRNTSKPIYITEFLNGVLRGLGRHVEDEVPRICKRIADQVLWDNARVPWRRSPFWLLFRVALQRLLLDSSRVGGDQNIGYKRLILYIMTMALQSATAHKVHTEALDHMQRKISRRAAKLQGQAPRELLEVVTEAIKASGELLAERFMKIQARSANILQWKPERLDVRRDTAITLISSRSYIDSIVTDYKHPSGGWGSSKFKPTLPWRIPQRHVTAMSMLKTALEHSIAGSHEQRTALLDVETWVEESLDDFAILNLSQQMACRDLFDLLKAYVACATTQYKGNPVDISFMLLTAATIWMNIDKIAVSICPLLKEYSCEADVAMFELLILPTETLLQRLSVIEQYIHSRSNSARELRSVYEDASRISYDSFAVRYYQQSPEHQALLEQIKADAQRDRDAKIQEFRNKKQEHDQKKAQGNAMACECISNRRGIKMRTCDRCNLLKSARMIKISVHEWPLPQRDEEARALAVELRLPPAFGAWRDATYYLLVSVFSPLMEKELSSQGFKSFDTLWTYDGLSRYNKSRTYKSDIFWMSDTKSFRVAHYKSRKVHVLTDAKDYLVPNGLTYKLALSGSGGTSLSVPEMLSLAKRERRGCLTKLCTFELPLSHSALQYALDSTEHTQNESIAKQEQCPQEWTLHEYDAFTTLRAGFRLQWLNVLRELRAGNLNLNRPETHLLLMQAVWQAGPIGTSTLSETATRETHLKLREEQFCTMLLDAMDATLTVIRDNWFQHVTMQTIICLGVRILSTAAQCSGPTRSRAVVFLRRCRAVCMSWLRTESESGADVDIQEWQKRVLIMAATCRLTYDVETTDLLSSEEDIADFIECAACIQANSPENLQSHEYRILLARDARLAHALEPRLRRLLVAHENWLDTAIVRVWPRFSRGGPWKKLDGVNERWFTTKTRESETEVSITVHYNILEGVLLANGKPFGRLAHEYTSHPTYLRLFGNKIFSVTQADVPGMEYQVIKPVYRDQDSGAEVYIYFAMRNSELIIRTQTGKHQHQIIPHSKLIQDFPLRMIKSFVHFFDFQNSVLEFRPLEDGKLLWIASPNNWVVSTTLIPGNATRHVAERGIQLIDYHSPTHQAITKICQSIESREYIEVTLSNNSHIHISLPRYQLEFEFDGYPSKSTTQIACRNFPGMVIDVRKDIGQVLGTLYGLKSYLVLREDASSLDHPCRTVIIPHGVVETSFPSLHNKQKDMEDYLHPKVTINTTGLERVGYHLYTIDTLLGSLVTHGSLKAKLFKIYLHALTAYCLPDPLTGFTGTEQALDELQSAGCMSFQKLDIDESKGPSEVNLLDLIACLTPRREYYPSPTLRVMEQVSWNKLPAYVQHEDFYKTVQLIIQHAEKMSMFPSLNITFPDFKAKTNENLHLRASIRASAYLPVEYGGSKHSRIYDREYNARERSSPELESRVFRTATLVKSWTGILHPVNDLQSIVEEWSKIPISTSSTYTRSNHYTHHWFQDDLADLWGAIYDFLRKSSRVKDQYKILFMLCSLAYRGENEVKMDLIESLFAFATNQAFRSIDPPHVPEKLKRYDLSIGTEPSSSVLTSILYDCAVSFHESPQSNLKQHPGESANELWARRHREYDEDLDKDIETAVRHYKSQWICSTVNPPLSSQPRLIKSTAQSIINEKFYYWYHNRNFVHHIAQVQNELERIRVRYPGRSTILQGNNYSIGRYYTPQPQINPIVSIEGLLLGKPAPSCENMPAEDTKENIDPFDLLLTRLSNNSRSFQTRYTEDLKESWEALKTESGLSVPVPKLPSLTDSLNNQRECMKIAIQSLGNIKDCLRSDEGSAESLLFATGLLPRVTPKSLLKLLTRYQHLRTTGIRLLQQMRTTGIRLLHWLRVLISYAEQISVYQRAVRLFECVARSDLSAFTREAKNKGRMGWNATDYPEWLLFEIENNLLIREVQAEIAFEMLAPKSGKNTVMQLNMGEGKSSVIVPIVAASLADQKKLVRIVVLKPLSTQMFHLLVQKLSGLLNRRIYYLPFSRDVKIDEEKVGLIQKMYEECMNNAGILLCQPEHILSFKLVGIENLYTDPTSALGPALVSSQHWLEAHTRDILDESDEILHVKYQLIYTLGTQVSPELAPDRWTIIQEIFTLVAYHMGELKQSLPGSVEVIPQKVTENDYKFIKIAEYPGSFPLTRLLNQQAQSQLMERIARDAIVEGKLQAVSTEWFTESKRELALEFITSKNIRQGEFCAEEMSDLKDLGPWFLLLRGLIAHGILGFILREKRWRVDYGLKFSIESSKPDDGFKKPKLAVPYRAKDSPAPRAEFGHPDVTIALTCLSYYYQGLSREQLELCFYHLRKLDNPAEEYLLWVQDCSEYLPNTLQSLNGINVEDNDQWERTIYPLLKSNKRVIDFFLSSIVFPKSCKEFPHKLMTTGWDLAEKKSHTITGFSGTNDNKYLLPVSMEQLDLPGQKHTNAKVLKHLLQPENNSYTCAKTTRNERLRVEELLPLLLKTDTQIQVLIDVGAQVLEMNNQELAKYWLGLTLSQGLPWTAVVFFNEDDEPVVIEKDGSIQPYLISPYVKNMEKCLVYLDETHTRGTDLKLPQNSVAAVTLGPKLTKDRLVQACMRMRQLGYGQSLRFFAPPEVHKKLLEQSRKRDGDEIGAFEIIEWVIHETCAQTERSIALWADQGIGHQSRQQAWDQHKTDSNNQALTDAWQQKEAKTLEQLYGIFEDHRQSICRIISEKLDNFGNRRRFSQLQTIQQRCLEFEITSLQEVSVQEEQEREIANEIEREKDTELPKAAAPAQHNLRQEILQFIQTGTIAISDAFVPLMNTLKRTSFANHIEEGPWATNLVATADFMNTVKLPNKKTYTTDDYLRPVTWILSSTKIPNVPPILCLVSPYEVNALLPQIQMSRKVNLHMYTPKTQRRAPTFENLRYAAIPAVGSDWTFEGKEELMKQVNLFAGQLYFESYEAYAETCGFLGMYVRDGEETSIPEGVGSDGFKRGLRKRRIGNINKTMVRVSAANTSVKAVENANVPFLRSPVCFLRELMGTRRKKMKFDMTHMGLLLHGKQVRKEDFE